PQSSSLLPLGTRTDDLSKNNTSRMKREFHVRFCERLEGETPSCLLSEKKVWARLGKDAQPENIVDDV
ncbi:MAG TPA: hypothetical protein VK589_27115, partial [Chryseolinea sp.]|nr:hypothetical protein [Chryseolinea sp.]